MLNSEKSAQKRNIMDYLPEHEKAKVKKLVERLGEEKIQKQKFQKLYQQMKDKYQQLNSKYEELQKTHQQMKAQMMTSRMALNKAKQAYIASKSAKKLRKLEQDESVQQNSTENENQKSSLKQIWLKIPRLNHNDNKPQETSLSRQGYVFQQTQNNQSHSNFNNLSYDKPPLPTKAQQTAAKRKSQRNDTPMNSNSKKEQIMNLRRQIQNLTQQMKKKQRTGLPLNEKIKKCEEIKNRYLKSKQKDSRKFNNQSQNQNPNEHSLQQQSFQQTYSNNKYKNIKPINLQKKLNEQIWKQQNKSKSKSKSKNAMQKQQQNVEQGQEQTKYKSKIYKTERRSDNNKYSEYNQNHALSDEFQEQKLQIDNRRKNGNKQWNEDYRTTRNKVEVRRTPLTSQYDESLFAIIDQLNSGN